MKRSDRRQVLVEELHDAGLRATAARVAVLDTLQRASTPLTHAEVAERLDDIGCDSATIYRNLMALTEAGLLTRRDRGDHRWRFEPAERRIEHEHPHFVCTDCGAERCVPEVEVRVERSAALPKWASRGEFDIRLRGICDHCATD